MLNTMRVSNVTIRGGELRGLWAMQDKPIMYRVMPKCACSSVGAILNYSAAGKFPASSVHDLSVALPFLRRDEILANPSLIAKKVVDPDFFFFTTVRNPFRRLLSCYLDKILGFQSDGTKYYAGHYHYHLQNYGMKFGPAENMVQGFRTFTWFVEDTITKNQPVPADVHWSDCTAQIRYTAWQLPEAKLTAIIHTEKLAEELPSSLKKAGVEDSRIAPSVPRENSTSWGDADINLCFNDYTVDRIKRIYANDFRLFKYSDDPLDPKPTGEIDVDEVNDFVRRS